MSPNDCQKIVGTYCMAPLTLRHAEDVEWFYTKFASSFLFPVEKTWKLKKKKKKSNSILFHTA